MKTLFFIAGAFLASAAPAAAIDLLSAGVARLDNGLTLIVLEDHEFPVVSVQTAYRVGARNDPAGRTGLAHFMEHMAFRQSENFPGTGLVDGIYAAGGEWHGYTWIDQTTYFATTPKEDLDLLLNIEADRMGRLDLAKEDVEAETGAVIAEMNSYKNDPATLLFDAVLAAMFEVHPYRNNSIGYEEDVRAITHADIAGFYARYYRPSNAVVAIVGDIDAETAISTAEKRFGKLKGGEASPLPPASEPPRLGERRTRLEGDADEKQFKIAYPAPSARSNDYAAFLVLQELLAGGDGASFLQNEWGAPAREAAPLFGAGETVTTWFIPTADPYIFMISGSIGAEANETALEERVQQALDTLAARPVDPDAFEHAREAVRRAILLDIQTTEDAAHQLAFFESIGALETLFGLDEALAAVSLGDIQRLANAYLAENQRTIGWFVPGEASARGNKLDRILPAAAARPSLPGAKKSPAPTFVDELPSGVPVLMQASSFSPTASMTIVVPGSFTASNGVEIGGDSPAYGYTSFSASGLSSELTELAAKLGEAVRSAKPVLQTSPQSDDPLTRLDQAFLRLRGADEPVKSARPLVIAVAGDIRAESALAVLKSEFADFPAALRPRHSASGDIEDAAETIEKVKAQTALGYIVPAPGGGEDIMLAWRMALYILAHDYGGRLGAEAISHQGLLYYIGADYSVDAASGWVTLSMGVDPDKLAPLRDLLRAELRRMVDEPPGDAEIMEAKRHLVGRKISAAQSSRELAAALAADWVAYGAPRDAAALEKALAPITREKFLSVLPAFVNGGIVSVNISPPKEDG